MSAQSLVWKWLVAGERHSRGKGQSSMKPSLVKYFSGHSRCERYAVLFDLALKSGGGGFIRLVEDRRSGRTHWYRAVFN